MNYIHETLDIITHVGALEQTALNTCIFLYFCVNKDNLDVNGLFSFHLVFNGSDIPYMLQNG